MRLSLGPATVLAMILPTPSAEARFETWEVDLACVPGAYVGRFYLDIADNGHVMGNSRWTCCYGPDNPITGTISGSTATLTRHLRVLPTGPTQIWTGQYLVSRTAISGRVSGYGGPCTWNALVTVTPGPARPAPLPPGASWPRP